MPTARIIPQIHQVCSIVTVVSASGHDPLSGAQSPGTPFQASGQCMRYRSKYLTPRALMLPSQEGLMWGGGHVSLV